MVFSFIGHDIIKSPQENIFFNRDFWKSKPSISKIDSCIKAGDSPSGLDRFAFDATSWAIIEDNPDETVKYLISMDGNDVNKVFNISKIGINLVEEDFEAFCQTFKFLED